MNGKERMAEQSRTWLMDAFFELLQTKPYEMITVKDISERAQLSRRTFYRAFKDKNDLLNVYGDGLIRDYIAALQSVTADKLNFERVLKLFFNFWWIKRDRVRILIHQNLFMNLLNRMNPEAPRLYDLFDAPWHIEGSQQEIAYIMSFSVGGFWNVLNTWLAKDDDQAQSPALVADSLVQALNKLSRS
ncbi:MAG: TetR/AcrR family transcriptional regulator [Lentilactobacillus diolivorans]|jgi:AcrR family transcriptional regulator|uniref:Transcriptional regulator n=2 Tax=Lentilactobacillus diolivorans TaxID=179838 RepID=A0A0R1SCP2_9LACO|nr:TetR/AcrR family transcriptional regulator [Lentilactobacillus diolivorans]KRL64053.1 transcriptional regulator [Lentilactobacillus diolivorans DSM 14421]MCH4165227.1 TetR/AcrR family transcriptional regulator [Lentilactobacillus diolivorans]RRG03805.1 MAG: TetR/AcrR family transcriptional regulator [Lactobacillus sp.]GEP25080.1 TetR family transcriptional regulator [Lentilactobacillus diolivorans]